MIEYNFEHRPICKSNIRPCYRKLNEFVKRGCHDGHHDGYLLRIQIIGRFRDDLNGGDPPHFSLKSLGGVRLGTYI